MTTTEAPSNGQENAPRRRFMDLHDINREFLPVARTTLWRWQQRPLDPFPQPVLGGNRNFWRRDAVEAWFERQERKAERQEPAPAE